MTRIDFYFDPVCPFAWAASRWLLDQSRSRDLDVNWHLMSLAILNAGQAVDSEKERKHLDMSRQLGRVVLAAVEVSGPKLTEPVYSALGRHLHEAGDDMTPQLVGEILSECGVDSTLAEAMFDDERDDALTLAHQESQDALGDTGGCPILCIDDACFFGPVLTGIPTGREADGLFDALMTLAHTSTFAEFQRPHDGPPAFN
ncbi:mycothiol-dependent nitroreductase Rv2466c family protein [Mycobacterium asiaticum]|uniref:Uncharacterized protein n=1 Tax=Mycobacterium asiaticum TaxID=1790 RepID=A0A1A3CBT4_MYCAS|nr:DsbA family protein [Mycobacterium asiaticum]OBI83256.1 hypothetical protein A9X01_21150 [Mycobacterium asiaticum]